MSLPCGLRCWNTIVPLRMKFHLCLPWGPIITMLSPMAFSANTLHFLENHLKNKEPSSYGLVTASKRKSENKIDVFCRFCQNEYRIQSKKRSRLTSLLLLARCCRSSWYTMSPVKRRRFRVRFSLGVSRPIIKYYTCR